MGLDNTRKILEHFDNPQLKVRTIHIAGTNGKGSTAAFTESILRASGFRVGMFTSPHLQDFRERIQINRKMMGKKDFVFVVEKIKEASEALKIQPTFFEFSAVMAFLHFFEKKTDWNIIETGLGGRLDATNLCKGEISIITTIAMDHTQYLGNTLKEISTEKAEIIKKDGIVIAGFDGKEAIKPLTDKAKKLAVPLYRLNNDFEVGDVELNKDGLFFNYRGIGHHIRKLRIPLLGRYQANNAALAVSAGLILNKIDLKITETSIRKGLLNTQWNGRLEIVSTNPTTILDCAHNPESVKELASAIRDHFTYKRCILVLGVMEDKPINQLIENIEPIADHIILVKPKQKRSADPEKLLKILAKSQKVVEIIEEIPYALSTARNISNPDDIICVTGSVFTVSEARQSIENEGTS
ncbi:MAG: bifunctional folylpolyglutamate synthase/dihydrofolate synthase [Nitrospinales bacterium]